MPERETWEPVIERKAPSCDTIRPILTAYGVQTEDGILWVGTATGLTPPEVREKYRRRCQLMAAAPDLLEAAKTALTTLEDEACNKCCFNYANFGYPCSEDCVVSGTINKLRAVIAKAEEGGERNA